MLAQNNDQLKTVYGIFSTNAKVEVMEYLETLQENVGQWAFIMKQQFMNAGLPEARWVSKAAEGFKGYALGWYIKIYGHKSAVK